MVALLQEFKDGPWKHNNLDAGATMIIPVPEPLAGAIVVGESVITYFNHNQLKTVPIKQTTVRVRQAFHLKEFAVFAHNILGCNTLEYDGITSVLRRQSLQLELKLFHPIPGCYSKTSLSPGRT